MPWTKPILERLSSDRTGNCQHVVQAGDRHCGRFTGTPHPALWRVVAWFEIDGKATSEREKLLCSNAAAAYCHAHNLRHEVFNP